MTDYTHFCRQQMFTTMSYQSSQELKTEFKMIVNTNITKIYWNIKIVSQCNHNAGSHVDEGYTVKLVNLDNSQ